MRITALLRAGAAPALAASALLAAPLLAPARHPENAPRVIEGRDGETRVVFSGDCAVDLDAHGRVRRSSRACSEAQLERAQDEVADIRRERRRERERSRGPRTGDREPPSVTPISRHGALEVEFRDGCTVRYDGRGKLRLRARECSDAQVERARKAAAAYRKERAQPR